MGCQRCWPTLSLGEIKRRRLPHRKQCIKERGTNHYDWLEKHLPTFLDSVGKGDWISARGLISAHADKCYSYRSRWEEEGLHFFHGAAIYLLSYLSPWSTEVRETKGGWVAPADWVIQNKDRFLPHLPPIEA